MSKLIKQLQIHEDFRGRFYNCTAGKKTIGFGRNVEANPLPVELDRCFDTRPMTVEEAEGLLADDVSYIAVQLVECLPFDFKELLEPRQAVLINMAFNLGLSGLLKFERMLAAIKGDDFHWAAYEMRKSRWANQVGKRACELSIQMMSGTWHDRDMA